MGLQCKICTFMASSNWALLKHYWVMHSTFGHRYAIPCLHLNCPYSFKRWDDLHTRLYKSHILQENEEYEVVQSFRCKICDTYMGLMQHRGVEKHKSYCGKEFNTGLISQYLVFTENEILSMVFKSHVQVDRHVIRVGLWKISNKSNC